MIDDESLMHINDSIFFLYVENAVKWRKLTVTEAAEEYNFWLNNIKAQAWEEGYIAGKAIGFHDGIKLIQEINQKYQGETK